MFEYLIVSEGDVASCLLRIVLFLAGTEKFIDNILTMTDSDPSLLLGGVSGVWGVYVWVSGCGRGEWCVGVYVWVSGCGRGE